MMKYNPITGEVCNAAELNRHGSAIPVEVITPPISEKPGEPVEKSTSKYDLIYHIFHF